MFIEIQLQAAYADGRLDISEEQMLLHICQRLGIPQFLFRQLQRMVEAQHGFGGAGRQSREAPRPSLDDAYAMLGVSASASDAEVKKAYRRLMSQHHPDKLVAKGLPEEMMKLAAEKTGEIRKAYEQVKEARGF